MTGWTAKDVDTAQQPCKQPATRPAPAAAPVSPVAGVGARGGAAKEPAEKHAQLPPPPAECGPWPVGAWSLRRATTYAPAARLVLTGPAADFERLRAYLAAYTPAPHE